MPAEYELAFVTEDIEGDFAKALTAGAKPVKLQQQKPWGQVVGYLKTPDNTLIELCTPIADCPSFE